MAAADVQAMIGAHHYQQIVAADASPFFVQMTIGHEGTSSGSLSGLGARVKEWGKRVVRALVHAFDPAGRVPARIYDGIINWHGGEDSRVAVGEVLHSRGQELSGVLHAEAVGYIYADQMDLREAIRKGERDCCSIEADVVVSEQAGRVIVEDVERATGVVLGHTSRQTPGFAGARVMALSEFCPPPDDPPAPAPKTPPPPAPPPRRGADKEQLIEQVKAAGLNAEDIFGKQEPPKPPEEKVPAPTEKKPEGEGAAVSLTDPKFNEFLPAE